MPNKYQYYQDIELAKNITEALKAIRKRAWEIKRMAPGKARDEASMEFVKNLQDNWNPKINALLIEDVVEEMKLNSDEIESLVKGGYLPSLQQMRIQIRQGRRIDPPT